MQGNKMYIKCTMYIVTIQGPVDYLDSDGLTAECLA